MQTARLVAIAALALFGAGGAGAAAPAPFHLVFDGKHNPDTLLHEGTFTSSSSWCPSGTAADTSIDPTTDTALRLFSCTGGGDFTAKVWPLPAEHGGSGSWQIVAGTGPLANLRGDGTFTSVRLSGNTDDPATITFQSSWDGVAALDITPPTIDLKSATARKLTRPRNAYKIRIVLSLIDTDGPVSYILQLIDPRNPTSPLASKVGQTTTGTATLSFRIRLPQRTHIVRIKIDANDAVGNTSAFAKAIRLP